MKCTKCNADMIKYQSGDVTEYICPVCDEAPVTQVDNLIEFDPGRYVVSVIPGRTYEKIILKEVSRVCSCNALEAKRILEETGYSFPAKDALDTRELKRKLDKAGIPYSIDPSFLW